MEPPSKRRRLFAPLKSDLSQHHYYETPASDDEDGPAYDPEQDLQQKRARLDFKLKSTFESIFEKYGKDFEGVGDEIDLYTGEILVDNGHLLQMRNERDAGGSTHARGIARTLIEDSEGVTTSSVEDDDLDDEDGEDDEEEEEDYDEEEPSDEDMIEDDMILRGFAQARQFMARKPSPQQETFDIGILGSKQQLSRHTTSYSSVRGGMFPSRSDILSQFGPQLGPEIVKYVSQQGVLEDDSVEPIWRAPPLPTTTSRRRPIIKPVLEPEIERSLSPDNSPSIWAAPKFTRFNAEEDELLLDFVASARRSGLDLSGHLAWEQLEEVNPRHNWKSWKARYEKKFSYLYSRHIDESEVSTSEISADAPRIPNQHDPVGSSRLPFTSSTSRHPAPPVANERPTRVRKQPPRDSTILNWTEAVATIKSVDPDTYAYLLKDVNRIKSDSSFGFQPQEPSSRIPGRDILQDTSDSRKYTGSDQGINGQSKQVRYPRGSFIETEDELDLHNSEFQSESQRVPCPHADCKAFPSTFHRLSRYESEELSPLCLHLLGAHHVTPFPCAEFNCDRKGDRGYFMQEDLVRHVKQAHPYVTALNRLRGRVDSDFFCQGVIPTLPNLSTQARPHTPESQPRDSDFMSPRGHVDRQVQLRTHMSFSNPAQDMESTPRGPAGLYQAVSTSASSLHVKPSLSTPKTLRARENSVERQYDSDVQILDGNPFSADGIPLLEGAKVPCSLKDSADGDEMFTTHGIASTHSHIHDRAKAPCTYPGCGKMISTAFRSTMIAHLKTHDKDHHQSSSSTGQHGAASKPPNSLPVSIPNSSMFSGDAAYNTAHTPTQMQTQTKGRSTTRTRITKPLPLNTVDPSYEFSDEEMELPPLIKEVPHASIAQPVKPRSIRNPMPPPEALAKRSSGRAVQLPLVTPPTKSKPRKSAALDVAGSEELDELSLPADDELSFISSRPRSGIRSNLELQTRVKREDTAVPGEIGQSSRKGRSSMLERSDELDELTEDLVTSTPAEQVPPLNEPPRVKSEDVEELLGISKPPGESQHSRTPIRGRGQSSAANTPLIDLVGHDGYGDAGMEQAAAMVPTSATDSSPTSRQTRARIRHEVAEPGSRMGILKSTGMRRGPRASIKQEGEDGVVWTPGGTRRRCGEDGFACGRPFCFTCP